MIQLPPDFSARLLRWYRVHGRTDLPWQRTREPYHVWLSEIMLQQTQVNTVIDYFNRFICRFPDVASLALASEDDVLALWSGMGYYTRARNLHRCAQLVVRTHGGKFPSTAEQLATLPGVGRSTAAAIAAFCYAERVAILDGNVKRVMARMVAFDGDVASACGQRYLWEVADRALPRRNLASAMPDYTQAIMDLGAIVCRPRRPDCDRCPMNASCASARRGDVERIPARRVRAPRRKTPMWLLVAISAHGEVWLCQRGHEGVWARLYCPPEFTSRAELLSMVDRFHEVRSVDEAPAFVHVLTHKQLIVHVVSIEVASVSDQLDSGAWYGPGATRQLGLPAPVRKLLEQRLERVRRT